MTAPTVPTERARTGRSGGSLVGTYGLPALTVLIFVLFALLLPDTFPTGANLRAILTNQSIPAILALGRRFPSSPAGSTCRSGTASAWPTWSRCG